LSEAHSAFDSLIKALHSQLEVAEATIASEVAATRASVPSTGVVNGELALERDEREKLVLEKHNKELEGMKGELGVVWIMLMRFARRAEGLRPARGIFTRARKDKYCPWSVYEAAGECLRQHMPTSAGAESVLHSTDGIPRYENSGSFDQNI
jgi:cleavage stimulation factor subunit 3